MRRSVHPLRIRLGPILSAALVGDDFDQSDALEPRPIVTRLTSVGAAVKDPFIIDGANVYRLDHAIVEREPHAFADHERADRHQDRLAR
jgi:hypothetical protein